MPREPDRESCHDLAAPLVARADRRRWLAVRPEGPLRVALRGSRPCRRAPVQRLRSIRRVRPRRHDAAATMTLVRRYRATVYDSNRWDGFELRPGDIIISTPPKCGTTWTQMICALLILQEPELPLPLDTL